MSVDDKIKRIDAWSEKLIEESKEHTKQYISQYPSADETKVRESFLLQKIAANTVLIEDLFERLNQLENKI